MIAIPSVETYFAPVTPIPTHILHEDFTTLRQQAIEVSLNAEEWEYPEDAVVVQVQLGILINSMVVNQNVSDILLDRANQAAKAYLEGMAQGNLICQLPTLPQPTWRYMLHENLRRNLNREKSFKFGW